MDCCDNFKLIFIFYIMISYKQVTNGETSSISASNTAPSSLSTALSSTPTEPSTSGSTTSPSSVSTETASLSSPSTTVTSTSGSTTSPSSVSTEASSMSSPSTTVTSTSGSTTSPSSVPTATSSLSSSSTTVTSTSGSTTSPSSVSTETSSFSSPSSTVTSTSGSTTSPSSLPTASSSLSSPSTTVTSTSGSTTSPSSLPTETSSLSSTSTTVTSTSGSTTSPSSAPTATSSLSSPSIPTTTSMSAPTASLSSVSSTISSSFSSTTTKTYSPASTTLPLSVSTAASSLSSPSTLNETVASVTLRSSSAATTSTTPPNSIVVDLGSRTLGLNFSLKVNLAFHVNLNNKTSQEFTNLSAEFTEKLTSKYKSITGFKYIQINEFRNGSVFANYSAVFSAAISVSEIVDFINTSVIEQLKNLSIFDVQVDSDYIETMQSDLESQKNIDICKYTNPKPCPFGFRCNDWHSGRVLCSDRCERQFCAHGTCYIDYNDEEVAKCRCPIDDDGYVYTGDRCEHKSLSTLIIITSGVGGGVLVAAFFIICAICIKMRRKEKESDDIQLDSFPDYSKYFPRSNTYQPKYGYDLPLNREKGTESQTLDGKSGYIPSRGDFHDNMTYMYDDLDTHLEDNNGEVNQERHPYDYIEMDKKFELRRPQLR